jgi:hypothetical protein
MKPDYETDPRQLEANELLKKPIRGAGRYFRMRRSFGAIRFRVN